MSNELTHTLTPIEKILVKPATAVEMLAIRRDELDAYIRSGHLQAIGRGPGLRIKVSSIKVLKEWRESANYIPPGFIYLVRFGFYHKIGLAKNVEARVRALDVGFPEPIELVHSFPTNDMRRAETQLHKQFAHCRARREWFRLTDEDVEIIKGYSALFF